MPSPLQPGRTWDTRVSCPLCPGLSLKVCRWEPFEVWVLLSEGLVQACRLKGAGGVGEKAGLDQGEMPNQMCALSVHWGLSRGHREGRSLVQPHTCRRTWGSTLWLSFRGAMDTSSPEICPRYGLPGARDAEAPGPPHLKDDHMWVCASTGLLQLPSHVCVCKSVCVCEQV